jgi:hypothetical protein
MCCQWYRRIRSSHHQYGTHNGGTLSMLSLQSNYYQCCNNASRRECYIETDGLRIQQALLFFGFIIFGIFAFIGIWVNFTVAHRQLLHDGGDDVTIVEFISTML